MLQLATAGFLLVPWESSHREGECGSGEATKVWSSVTWFAKRPLRLPGRHLALRRRSSNHPADRLYDHEHQASVALPPEIWALVAANFVIALGFGIVAPAVPQFAHSFGVGVAAASTVISAFALMRVLFAPIGARLMQRCGERPVYLTGLVITALSSGACVFAQSFWQLLVFRSLGGIGSTMFTVSALGLIARIAPPHGRGRVSGLYATSFLLGWIIGPLVGSVLVHFGLRVPFAIYSSALLIAAALVYLKLRNSAIAASGKSGPPSRMSFHDGLAVPAYRAALWSNFADGWVVDGVRMALVPLFVIEVLGADPAIAGIALTVFGAGTALMLFPAGRLSDRFGRKPFLLVGTAVSGIATVAMGFTASLPSFLAAALVAGLGSGLINSTQQAAVADIVGSKARGGPVFAAFGMAADIGAVLGPIVAGALAQWLSYSAAFAITGAVLLIATVGWLSVADTLARPSHPAATTPTSDQTREAALGRDPSAGAN
ncbi:MFS transporter [Mycobacterium sp.]|uniref:MFS transporter n=1 Tax=Mycobacterium sp. TaxID=1785 RepID=UPI0025D1036E|nr:MFS transporter [Mycobacterium sp.]